MLVNKIVLVTGSIPVGVIGIFNWLLLLAAVWPWGWFSLRQKLVPGSTSWRIRRPVR